MSTIKNLLAIMNANQQGAKLTYFKVHYPVANKSPTIDVVTAPSGDNEGIYVTSSTIESGETIPTCFIPIKLMAYICGKYGRMDSMDAINNVSSYLEGYVYEIPSQVMDVLDSYK